MTAPDIVVGAGMAGIMAARTLVQAGREVLVLEARDRVGGRTWTDHTLGTAVDLGAAWIHGPDGNPLLPLADQLGLTYAPTDFINRGGGVVQAFDAAGRPLPMDEYSRGQRRANGAYILALASEVGGPVRTRGRSYQRFLQEDLPIPTGMSPAEAAGFHYWSTVLYEYLSAADQEEIDWWLAHSHARLPGGDLLLYGGGFNRITDALAAPLDIRTGVVVTGINHGPAGVTVTTTQGTLSAAAVIVTVPLGVLQAEAIQFDPPLSAEKQGAIARIGFGQYEKLALRFDRFYWPREVQRFNYLSESEPSLFNVWLNLGAYTGEPILVLYHAGGRARHVNRWSDDAFVTRAVAVMERLFGAQAGGPIPPPVAHVRTGWQADPFARGSYSFDRLGQQPGDRRRLAAPEGPHLFFAGEASHAHFYATVHGAYESGIRAARQRLQTIESEP